MKNTQNFSKWQKEFALSLFNELSPELHSSFENSYECNIDKNIDANTNTGTDLKAGRKTNTPILEKTLSHTANQKRFSIYQNNVFHSLTTALGDLYPVVKKLVGDDFFNGTAHFYLRGNPPSQAAMVYFAHDFPEFLSQFEHTQTLTYLAPVAKLELAKHRAYHAEDKTPLTMEVIASIHPDELSTAKITLHPSLQLLQSTHPILDIWHANQDDADNKKTIDINEPQYVLVVRPLYSVSTYTIDECSYYFIHYLQSGCTLQEAISRLLNEHGHLVSDENKISQLVNFLISEELISDITLI